ncbi:glycosyltransferase 87 family protein [Streptacidiphilus sp. ASG 303]|uniref:glycosyltransferase family 87 protein n=1 Tax=Streptacidiphilus sp. ASG 303 TaxID=2896847 RepID=UPI001E4AF1FA|nr:glycosyltransferase 87 family protein [Streptacidiphilus sp. ASG 303]MCD0482185.1 glycosyltransferase 87 family protein [Streptacidiphilus sp. ASG 303]
MRSSVHDESAEPEPSGPPADTVVVPADEDPVAAAGSEVLGGPPGRRALLGVSWWTPGRVLALTAVAVFVLGMVQKAPCYSSGWFYGATTQYTHACYSDIPHLFSGRGFAQGLLPYRDMIPAGADGTRDPHMQYLEYPVLTGLFMQVATWLTPRSGALVPDREQWFWLVNAGMLMVCAVVAVVAVMRTHRRRPWDALLLALAPALALNATVNWDLLAVALTAVGMAYWSARRPVAAGVLIGLATAAKLYPALLLGPLLVLCWRTGRWRAFLQALGGAVAAWALVNVPVVLWNTDGWVTFYSFSKSRGEDFGSLWLVAEQIRGQALGLGLLNTAIAVLLVLCCLGIGWLALSAPHRPRFAQLAFLVVAAFVVTNKVYSPQYVLWLIPLAALARPRWRDFLIWQACEVAYFLGVWMYLAYTSDSKQHGIPVNVYDLVVVVHVLGTLYLCAVVVRDILLPERDPVRWDGSDDPSGGVLDGAPDRFVLGQARWAREQASYAAWAPDGGDGDWFAPPAGERPPA